MARAPVLTVKEQATFIYHQTKFSKSHTFYRPHETFTHKAFPLDLLIGGCFSSPRSMVQAHTFVAASRCLSPRLSLDIPNCSRIDYLVNVSRLRLPIRERRPTRASPQLISPRLQEDPHLHHPLVRPLFLWIPMRS